MNSLVILSSLGAVALLSEILKFKKLLYPIVLFGLIVASVFNYREWVVSDVHEPLYGMLIYDNYAIAFMGVILLVSILWLFMSQGLFADTAHISDYSSLILFALCGASILVSYSNLTMLFLGIEILSIPMYILAGSRKDNLFSNEAALKYFLMGSFATGFLLFGITLIYGATGSFNLQTIAHFVDVNQNNVSPLLYTGILLLMVGLCFKVSAVPFHFWAPDVYQGSPSVITAFMSTVVKTAAVAAFFRLFFHCFYSIISEWSDILLVIIALTLVVSNVTAVFQINVKRMLAYSSISHAGFMLIALLSINSLSKSSILYYTLAYGIASIAVFTVIVILSEAKGTEDLSAFNGLAKKNPLLAVAMTIGLLSLAGIPPMSGFAAKYFILLTALKNHHTGVVILAILTSLVGVYYYFKVIIAMFAKEEDQPELFIDVKPVHQFVLFVCCALTILLGILPEYVAQLL